MNISASASDISSQILNIAQGFLSGFTNLSLAIFILSVKKLRIQKEYTLFVGLMFYDSLYGFSWMLQGVEKLIVFKTNECKLKKISKNAKKVVTTIKKIL